jgi:hypothetical protein
LSTAGTVSPATICQLQNAAFFLSPMGIMAFDGTKCERLCGNALNDFWATVNTDRAALSKACSAVHEGRLLVALPVGGSEVNNCVLEFRIAEGTFMLRTGIRVDAWLPGEMLRFASLGTVCIWGQDAEGEKVNAYGSGAGSAIPMRWETPESDFGSRDCVKTVTGVSVTGKGGALSVTVKADGKATAKTIMLPEEPGTAKARFHASGRLICITLENVEGSNVEVSGATVFYERDED